MRVVIAVGLLVMVTAAGAADLTVVLPPGETSLLDVGMYRVGYQSYDGPVVWMPDSWVGHFEPVAGISYMPGYHVMGQPALLIHSPWHIPPGKAWVDYRVKLPQITPITLSFGITMGEGMMAPKMSDGVTFSAAVNDKELMRENYTKEEWKQYDLRLDEYAGQAVTVRLQVEPGPKNDASFDYSFWGTPKIVCGQAGKAREELLKQLTGTKAYRATAATSLVALSNDPKHGVTPSNLLPCQTALAQAGKGYDFTYKAADCGIVYHYEPQAGTLDDFTVRVDDGRAMVPAAEGGVFVEQKVADRMVRTLLTGGKAVSVEPAGDLLKVRWEYPNGGQPVPVDWTFGLRGKALTVQASCAEPVLVGLSLGRVTQAPLRRMLSVPYLPANGPSLCYLPGNSLYVARYLDWTVSHSSSCPVGESSYDTKTDGTRNPLFESGYVAVSPSVDEVLPNTPWPASPYLKLLGPRIMLDVWGHHKGTYAGDAANIRDLKDNGVDHLAIIQHDWQRWGYDAKLPDHVPANPAYGGDEGMIAFGKAANEAGYVWAVHENYIDLYPDAPSYDPSARVLKADGQPAFAWYNPGTKVQSFGEKCNRAKGYAEQNAPYAHKTYGTTAAYLDVHTCVPPWHELDHDATQPLAAMEIGKVKNDSELFQYMRDTHGGPLFGEGNNQFYWAGKADGVEGQVNGGEDHAPFLDLDLLKMHPQMVNHGMGYYERWFMTGQKSRWGANCGTMEQIDKYRAQSLAYGHAGFIGSRCTDNVQWVAKEHNLMSPVTSLYGTAKPARIEYQVGGQLVSASAALAVGDTWRQVIEYDSGLKLFVNWSKEPWQVGDRLLPQWGYLATGPGTESSTTLKNGHFADYAECPEFLFADARTSMNLSYFKPPVDIEPKIGDFKYLGGNKVQLTYNWIVNETLDQDYHCFVHFDNAKVDQGDNIVAQQDHNLPEPTTQWQKGETVIDGPYEISLPDTYDSYEAVIGLFNGPRLALKGIDVDEQRILLGTLKLTKQDGKITNIVLLPPTAAGEPKGLDAFGGRLNTPGTMLDFGKIATDGAVKINRGEKSLTLFPYPRDRQFTVSLDLKAIAPQAKIDPAQVTVRALAASTQADMGKVAAEWVKGRLVMKLGMKGAGRYVVGW